MSFLRFPAALPAGETLTPEQNLGEWDPQDPNFKSLVHEVAGSISSRPGGAQEMGPVRLGCMFCICISVSCDFDEGDWLFFRPK